MNEDRIIYFYDPSDGKRFTFNTTVELNNHLQQKLLTLSAQSYLRYGLLIIVNMKQKNQLNTILSQKSNLQKNLRDKTTLEQNSDNIKALCAQDLTKRSKKETQRQAEEQKSKKKRNVHKVVKGKPYSPIKYSLRKIRI